MMKKASEQRKLGTLLHDFFRAKLSQFILLGTRTFELPLGRRLRTFAGGLVRIVFLVLFLGETIVLTRGRLEFIFEFCFSIFLRFVSCNINHTYVNLIVLPAA